MITAAKWATPSKVSESVAIVAWQRKAVTSSSGYLLIWLACLIAIYTVVLSSSSGQGGGIIAATNIFGPSTLIIAAGVALYVNTQRGPVTLWTAHSVFLASVAVYSGLGPLAYYFGNKATIVALTGGKFGLSEYELLRTNVLNAVGIASVLTGFNLFCRVHPFTRTRKRSAQLRGAQFSIEWLAVSFLVAGGLLRYLIILPFQFGQTSFVLPGIFNNLQHLFDLGLALTAYIAVKRGGRWSVILWLLLPIHLASIILQFTKAPIIITLLLVGLGGYLAHESRTRFAIWVITMVAIYSSMQPLVNYGRQEIGDFVGHTRQATLEERRAITARFLTGERAQQAPEAGREQAPWMRIAYSGPQAYAMRERDRGFVNNTMSDIWVVFIPRLIWPDKPIGIGPGQDFYEYVTGRNTTRVGITVYADAYWNHGWPGVVLVGTLMGMIFALMSTWTLYWLQTGQFVYLPAIMISILAASTGPTGWVISGLFGALPIYFAYVAGIFLIMRFYSGVARPPAAKRIRIP